jgi:hypothetical protein
MFFSKILIPSLSFGLTTICLLLLFLLTWKMAFLNDSVTLCLFPCLMRQIISLFIFHLLKRRNINFMSLVCAYNQNGMLITANLTLDITLVAFTLTLGLYWSLCLFLLFFCSFMYASQGRVDDNIETIKRHVKVSEIFEYASCWLLYHTLPLYDVLFIF